MTCRHAKECLSRVDAAAADRQTFQRPISAERKWRSATGRGPGAHLLHAGVASAPRFVDAFRNRLRHDLPEVQHDKARRERDDADHDPRCHRPDVCEERCRHDGDYPSRGETQFPVFEHCPTTVWRADFPRCAQLNTLERLPSRATSSSDPAVADEAAGEVQEGFGTAKRKVGDAVKDLGNRIKH